VLWLFIFAKTDPATVNALARVHSRTTRHKSQNRFLELEQHTPIYPIRTDLPHRPPKSLGTTIPRSEFHLPPHQPPTKPPPQTTVYKPSNNDNDYSHPLGKSFIILLVEHYILVHIILRRDRLRESRLADNLKTSITDAALHPWTDRLTILTFHSQHSAQRNYWSE
jgi:hypothetical protein